MKHNFLKVIDNPELIRDGDNKAILNTSNDQLEIYRKKRERERKLSSLEHDVKEIQKTLSQVKHLLDELVTLRGNN